MYKALIVDDETLIINGLKKIIDWENLNITIEDTASNGEEALDKFISNPVDIVITDIMMPKMNGMELIRKIKDINENTKFIILSGHDDFNYAKQAILMGIENYILKPINENELEATLENVIHKLDIEKKHSDSESKNKEILRQNISYRWVTNKIKPNELQEREFILDIDLTYSFYCVGVINIFKNQNDNESNVYNIIKSLNKEDEFTFFKDLENNIICVYGSNIYDGIKEKMKSSLEKEMDRIIENFHIDVFITVGTIGKGFINVFESYKNAKKLEKFILVKGYNKIVTYDDVSENKNRNIIKEIDIEDFYKVLLSKNIRSIEEYIDKVFYSLSKKKDLYPEDIQNIAIKLILVVYKVYYELNINVEIDKDLIIDLCNIKTIEELKNSILNKCKELISCLQKNTEKKSPVITQILTYIKTNYHENITLKELGYKFNINSNYLGQLFHKEVGEAFSHYINRIKHEKAKELLFNTNLKVNEIAERIGYVDVSYFYRKFKEYHGVSPNTLRKSKNYT